MTPLIAAEVSFRLFLLAFHGYLIVLMLGMIRETIPRIAALDAKDPFTQEAHKESRATYHRRSTWVAWVAVALQAWGLFAALVSPLYGLTGFFAWASPAIVTFYGYKPWEMTVKRVEDLERLREEFLGRLADGRIERRTLWTYNTKSSWWTPQSVLGRLEKDGLIELYVETPYQAFYQLTGSGKDYVGLIGVTRSVQGQKKPTERAVLDG